MLLSMSTMAAKSDTIRFCGFPRPLNENGNRIFALYILVSSGNVFNGTYAYAPNLENRFEQMVSMGGHHICVDYQLPIESNTNGLFKFSKGTVDQSSLKCQYGSQYTGWSCVTCPTGYIANIPGDSPGSIDYVTSLHTNTTCAYCAQFYYRNGSSCDRCPDDGYTSGYDSSITDCYIWTDTQTDSTGTYAAQQCYYQS